MESQFTEWKESWRDEYLKTICAFANSEGGVLTVGIDDRGRVIGAKDPERLLKVLPDTIRNKLGIVPFVRLNRSEGKETVSIPVERSPVSVTLDGKFYIRSGSTTQLISGRELEVYLLNRIGMPWTEEPVRDVSVKDLSPEAILAFKNMGVESGRLMPEDVYLDPTDLLEKLDMFRDGMLKRSAVLLFHPRPGRYIPSAVVKIGMFEGADLLFHDELTGPLMIVADRAVDLINTKYSVSPVKYNGIVRLESKPYPMAAVREAVMNAIVHNDYSSQAPIQVKVFPNSLTVYNSGGLPLGWTVERLIGSHRSVPRNPSMANVFFRAGLIESFGRGIGMIMSQFEGRDVPPPVFDNQVDEFSVTFSNEVDYRRGFVPDDVDDDLRTVMGFLVGRGSGTYAQISEATGLSTRQIQRLVSGPVDEGLILKSKAGREVVLTLRSG